jgi:hypothetical protein
MRLSWSCSGCTRAISQRYVSSKALSICVCQRSRQPARRSCFRGQIGRSSAKSIRPFGPNDKGSPSWSVNVRSPAVMVRRPVPAASRAT